MRAALGVVVALGVAGGLLQWAGPWRTAAHAAGAPPGAVYRVARQDFTVTLTELGRLVAQDSRKVVFEAEGQNKIVSLVEEGKQVAEGEVLLTCDTTNVEKRIEELGLALAQAESDLRTAQTELEIQEAENAAEVEKTAATLDRARKELQRYREADAPQERRGLEVKLKDTQTAFRRAKKRYEDSQNLLAKGYLKQAELETDQIAYEKALVEKEGAEQALSVFDRYTLPMTLDEKETKVRDAARDQETAAKRAGSRMLQRQVTLTSAQKRLEQNRTSLDEARQDLEHLVVRSPCPGIVIYGDPKGHEWYRTQVKVGGEVWAGFTVMTIPDLRRMQVQIAVHEADITKVALGQRASVSMDTYPGRVLEGSVTRIAAIASTPEGEREAEVKEFAVEVTLDGAPGLELKPGISAKAVIHVGEVTDALVVPLQCVFLVGGRPFCFVATAAGPEQRAVTVGPSSATWVAIESGLSDGEAVLLYNPNLRDAAPAPAARADG